MPRKRRFTPAPATKREVDRAPETRRSGPAPKSRRERSEAPTLPPPPEMVEHVEKRSASGEGRGAKDATSGANHNRASGMRSRKGARSTYPAATVDEVTADMSNDPRRERDDDSDE
jgi:hypothetical protein